MIQEICKRRYLIFFPKINDIISCITIKSDKNTKVNFLNTVTSVTNYDGFLWNLSFQKEFQIAKNKDMVDLRPATH